VQVRMKRTLLKECPDVESYTKRTNMPRDLLLS